MDPCRRINNIRQKYNMYDQRYQSICRGCMREKELGAYFKSEYYLFLLRLGRKRVRKVQSIKLEGLYGEYRDFMAAFYRQEAGFLLERGEGLLVKLVEYPWLYCEVEKILISLYECHQRTVVKTMWEYRGLKVEVPFFQYKNLVNFDNFYGELARRSEKLEKLKNGVIRGLKAKKPRMIFEKAKNLAEEIENFIKFAEENFLEAQELKIFLEEVLNLKKLLENFLKFESGEIQVEKDLLNFKVPKEFQEASKEISELIEKRKIDNKNAKKILQNFLGKKLNPQSNLCHPFPPVFYDIAFDFINYPEEEKNLLGMIKKMNIFSKK